MNLLSPAKGTRLFLAVATAFALASAGGLGQAGRAGPDRAKPHEPQEVFRRVLAYVSAQEKEARAVYSDIRSLIGREVLSCLAGTPDTVPRLTNENVRDLDPTGLSFPEAIRGVTDLLDKTGRPALAGEPPMDLTVTKRSVYQHVFRSVDDLWGVYLAEARIRIHMLNAAASREFQAIRKLSEEKEPELAASDSPLKAGEAFCVDLVKDWNGRAERLAAQYPPIAERLLQVRRRLRAELRDWADFSRSDDYPGDSGREWAFETLAQNDFNPESKIPTTARNSLWGFLQIGSQCSQTFSILTDPCIGKFEGGVGADQAERYAKFDELFAKRYPRLVGRYGDSVTLQMTSLFGEEKVDPVSAEKRKPKLYLYAQTISRLQHIDRLYVNVPTVVEAQFEPPYDKPEYEIEISIGGEKLKLTAARMDNEGYIYRTSPFLPEGALSRKSDVREAPGRRGSGQ